MSKQHAVILGIILSALSSALVYHLTGQQVPITVQVPVADAALPADVTPCAMPDGMTPAADATQVGK